MVAVGSKKRSSKLLKTIQDKLKKRNKLIKLADRSDGGLDTVKEYLSDNLADHSEDGRRMASAE